MGVAPALPRNARCLVSELPSDRVPSPSAHASHPRLMKPPPHAFGLTRAALPVAATLALVALLFMTHAYTGIRHDSILYFGQALLQIDPSTFEKDLFFEFGSQAQFTIFPRLMAWALQYGTPGQVSMGFTAVGLLLFFFASAGLLSALFSDLPTRTRLVALGLFAVLAFPPGYGAFFIFGYAEPFVTGRTFAEPLVLLSLALLVHGRWLAATVVAILAASIHPLQALPAMALIWGDRIRADRRWLWLAVAAVPAVMLAFAGVAPFDRLIERYDPEWLQWTIEPNRNAFFVQWPWPAWGQLATDFFLLSVAAVHAPNERARRFSSLLLFVGLSLFLAAAIFAEAARLVFPTSLQLWRVQWLVHWTALGLLPASFLALLRKPAPDGGLHRAILLLGVAFLGMPAGKYSAAIAAPIAMLVFVAWPALNKRTTPAWRSLAFWAIPIAVGIAYVRFLISLWPNLSTEHADRFVLLLLHPLPLSVAAFGFWWIHSKHFFSHRTRITVAAIFSASLLIFSLTTWDQRSTWSRVVENNVFDPNPFGVKLADDKQVYWYHDLLLPWLTLRRASYWNGYQAAGLLFNRGTAAAFNDRERVTQLIEFQGQICSMLNTLENDRNRCFPEVELFTRLCNHSDTLGYVVVPFNLPLQALGTWHIPKLSDTDREVTYRLYSCEAFK